MNTSYIRNRIKRYFVREDVDEVLGILSAYDEKPRPDFTCYAILSLSRGDKRSLPTLIERAMTDRQAVLSAAANVESWERAVANLNSDVTAQGPHLEPLLQLARALYGSDIAENYYASRSVGRLLIAPGEQSHVPCMVFGISPIEADARPQIECYAGGQRVDRWVCGEADLVPDVVRRLDAHRGELN